MLYSEFIQGTGCKDTPYNYEVYKNLEILYINSSMSHVEIYEYGKKLVDNSQTDYELKIENETKQLIDSLLSDSNWCKQRLDWLIQADADKSSIKYYRDIIKENKDKIKWLKNTLKDL